MVLKQRSCWVLRSTRRTSPQICRQAPRIISTFLESYDFSGKTIVPFCTSHSSGIGSSAADLHALCPDSVEWVEGMRFEAGTARDAMEEWIQRIGIG
ncbi:flavodoxin [uncultured Acetatifactor sp.]|uniref:flavodoxin n=1 Tax=uncultured Acetatifactor sp. TaxID=1671927 RepID=UPI002ED30045